jgi:hypothetical protein
LADRRQRGDSLPCGEAAFKHLIYITNPFDEPENPIRLVTLEPPHEATHLRWSWDGRLLLMIIDGDVYSYPVPERFWDRP